MKKMLSILLLMIGPGQAAPVSTISQYGITWYFDGNYESGQFANGDYWVVGPVTIDSITPHYVFDTLVYTQTITRWINGWEVNPVYAGGQGVGSEFGSFDSTLVPGLPYTAQAGQSIVKTVRSGVEPRNFDNKWCRECLQTAAVLTVVGEVPPDSGASVFRPPYVGTDKSYYHLSDMNTGLLPTLVPVNNTPTLENIQDRFKRVQLDHKPGMLGFDLHPIDNMPDYGAVVGTRNAEGALRLMLNDPLEDKMPVLIAYVQYGIDLYHMILSGHVWPEGGGHRPGQKLPLVFAAVILDHQGMKDTLSNSFFLHENELQYHSDVAGRTLYGSPSGESGSQLEEQYWSVLLSYVRTGSASGYKSFNDPYGYIDGGPVPGDYYQFCCTSQPWKGEAIAVLLLPEMQSVWTDWSAYVNYSDRWVDFGIWSQPDPCAPPPVPPDSIWPATYWEDNYGVTFGPDGSGGCIQDTDPADGTGRYPSLHGTKADEGYYRSNFVRAMWDEYRGSVEKIQMRNADCGLRNARTEIHNPWVPRPGYEILDMGGNSKSWFAIRSGVFLVRKTGEVVWGKVTVVK